MESSRWNLLVGKDKKRTERRSNHGQKEGWWMEVEEVDRFKAVIPFTEKGCFGGCYILG